MKLAASTGVRNLFLTGLRTCLKFFPRHFRHILERVQSHFAGRTALLGGSPYCAQQPATLAMFAGTEGWFPVKATDGEVVSLISSV